MKKTERIVRLSKRSTTTIKSAIKYIYKKSVNDNVGMMAGSLAYTTVLSLIPILAIAYFAFDMVGGMDRFETAIEGFIGENIAPSFADKVIDFVQAVRHGLSPRALGIFGVLGFVWAGVGLLSKIELALNLMWNRQRSRPWINKLTTYWTILSLGPLLIGVSIVFTDQILKWLQNDHGELAKILVFLARALPYVTSPMLFTMVYLWMPAQKIRFKSAFWGGLLTGVIFEVAKTIYAIYATHALQTSIYGSLAVLPIFLLWLNFIWLIFLIGGEICHFLNERPDVNIPQVANS